jgi:hypothetical protein
MKKVLFVTYYFPPSGGPGVQRVLKFIKYLPKFGWEPIVFTVSNGQHLGYDESLFKDLPAILNIYKSKTIEPYSIYNFLTGKDKSSTIDVNTAEIDYNKLTFKLKISEFIRATFFIPDARIGWRFTAPETLSKIFRENKIDAVYTSSPPYTPAIIGDYIKRNFKVPWIASFRDPWTGYKGTPKRWFIPKLIERKLEKDVFNNADAIEVAWDGIIDDAMSKYNELDTSKFYVIYNGFDPEDLPEIKKSKNEKFTFTYTGTLYTIQDPELLLKAVSELIIEGQINKEKIKFRFVGRIADEISKKIQMSDINDSVEIIGYKPHNQAMEILAETDVSLLIGVNSKEKYVNVPGKTFEYIGLGKPIFLIAPLNSKLSEIVGVSGLGYGIDHTDIKQIKETYLKMYNDWRQDEAIVVDKQKIMQHSRINGAEKLSKILNSVI